MGICDRFSDFFYFFRNEVMITSYNDLTSSQIKKLLPLVLQLRGFGTNSDFALICLSKICKLLNVTIAEAEKLTWLWTTKITKRPFRYVRVGWRFYFLPKENYADTSSIEVAMANIFYLKFANKGSVNFDALPDLLSVLCRPLRWNFLFRKLRNDYDGNDRVPYNSIRSEQAAKYLKALPIGEAFAILQYFESMNELFLKSYSEIFDDDEGARQLFANGEGWIATLEDVAKDGVHGNFDTVCGNNVHTTFMYLKHRKIQFLEQIRQSEKEH